MFLAFPVFMSFFAVFSQFIYVCIYVLAIEVFYRKPTCLPNAKLPFFHALSKMALCGQGVSSVARFLLTGGLCRR